MTPAKRPPSHRSPSPTLECCSLSPAMLPVEPEERLAQMRCIAVSSPDVAEEADDHYWRQALKQLARLCGHVSATGYDIEVIDSDGLRRAMSQVKWPTPNCWCGTTPMGSQGSLLWLPGRGVVRIAGLIVNTRIVYPGSGCRMRKTLVLLWWVYFREFLSSRTSCSECVVRKSRILLQYAMGLLL